MGDGGDGMAGSISHASLGFDNRERADLSEVSGGSSIAFVA